MSRWMCRASSVAICALGLGCLSFGPQDEPRLSIVEVLPSDLGDDDVVEVVVSDRVGWLDGPGLDVWTPDGLSVPHRLRLVDDGRRIVVEPVDVWPTSSHVGLRLAPGLMRDDGRAWEVDTATRTVKRAPTFPPDRPPELRIAAPAPGLPAPANLGGVAVAVVGPVSRAASARLWLERADQVVDLIPEASSPGRVRLRPSRSLDAGVWRLGGASDVRIVDGVASEIIVATGADRRPPTLTELQVEVTASRIRLHLSADEPFFVEGRAGTESAAASGAAVTTAAWNLRSTTVEVEPRLPHRVHRIELELVDLAGNRRAPEPMMVRSAPELRVELSEVVATPLRDWGDSEAAGVPLDGFPGSGAVSDADEWVELVNRSQEVVDLRTVELTIEVLDSSPSITEVRSAPGWYFGGGGSMEQWRPGEALVVRPRGALSSKDVEVSVRSGTEVLDRVRLGPDGGEHPGGAPPDAVHESVARSVSGRWEWCVPTPGDPAPSPSCR